MTRVDRRRLLNLSAAAPFRGGASREIGPTIVPRSDIGYHQPISRCRNDTGFFEGAVKSRGPILQIPKRLSQRSGLPGVCSTSHRLRARYDGDDHPVSTPCRSWR